MSQQRPRDLLEFLRRTSSSTDESEPRLDGPERRSLPRDMTRQPVKVNGPRPAENPRVSDARHVNVSQGDTPMVVLRRSQVIVAGITAGLLIVLAYLLGSTWSGEEPADQVVYGDVGVYTIAVIEYHDNAHGQISAKTLKADLAKLDWDEVLIEQLDRDRKLWVTIGSWVSNPYTNRQAMSMLSEVKKLRVQGSDKFQFADARFVRIKR